MLPRHQTLEASIRWSHELLTEAEQVLLRRLAMFNGGCTLDDAEAVTADGTLAREEILDLLDRLVAQSLVQLDDTGAAPRYRLLETVRLYALQRLEDAGEADLLRVAHADHFFRLALVLGPQLEGPGDLPAFGRLAPELDNLRSALDTLALLERWDDQANLISSSLRLWPLVAAGDAARRLTGCLEPAGRLQDPSRARALLTRSAIISFLGDAIGSVVDATAALELSEEPQVRGRALTHLATSTAFFDTPAADPIFTQAVTELEAVADAYGEAEAQIYRTAVWSCFRADMLRGAEYAAVAAPLVATVGGCYLHAYKAATGAISSCLRGVRACARAERRGRAGACCARARSRRGPVDAR